MTGVELIAAERTRQIEVEGYDSTHDDDEHWNGDLSMATCCYVIETRGSPIMDPPDHWPFAPERWKPSPNQLRNLAKAGALIAAEMDRLMRFEE